MKIKFNSDDNLPLNKLLKLDLLPVIVTSAFEDGKHYPQVFLDECLNEILISKIGLIFQKEAISTKKNASKECDICRYWYVLAKNVKYEPNLWDGCHDLIQKLMTFNDIAVVSVKGIDYRNHFWYMSKNDAKNIMKNSNLNETSGSL